jgi:site-specific DNA recombinase
MAPKCYSKDSSAAKIPLLVLNEESPLIVEAFEMFSTGLYTAEQVRKTCVKKGLEIGKTQFGLLLRNLVYIGKIYVPELDQELACLVDGVH